MEPTSRNVEKGSLDDHYLCTDIDRMEKIALQVPLSETKRPGMGCEGSWKHRKQKNKRGR